MPKRENILSRINISIMRSATLGTSPFSYSQTCSTAEDLSRLSLKHTDKIAVQSPCTLQHGQKLTGVMEKLLQGLGYTLSPVADAHLCCGSAGTYSLLQPELAGQLGKNKITALEQHHPDIIATANIGCLTHLQSKTQTPVRHWIEIVAGALEI